jgi:hypothetical protein
MTKTETPSTSPGVHVDVGSLIPEEPDLMTTTSKPKKKAPVKKAAAKPVKKAVKKPASVVKIDTRTSALPPLEPEMMNDILHAIHDKAIEVDAMRDALDGLIAESDALVREAVDDGDRYRDIAASANRTVPWVQMSLRRCAGVSTHPAAPIPTARVRTSRAS